MNARRSLLSRTPLAALVLGLGAAVAYLLYTVIR
jgi:hypothetical protein